MSTFPTHDFPQRDNLILKISQEVRKLIKQTGLKYTQIKAVGLGVPGLVDSQKGLIYYLPNVEGWQNTPIKKILEDKLRIPIFVDNDVNLMALAESVCGAGRGVDNFVSLTLGTGVGGGIFINGQLYRGSNSVAGEVGHIPIKIKGNACNCGGRGCLESYVGNQHLVSLARRHFGKTITLEELEKKAKRGNKAALKIWKNTGERIGFALVGVVNLLNPARIIIGGGVAKAGNILLNSIRQTVKQYAMPVQAKNVKIVTSALGYNAGLMGAAIFARMNLARLL